jgi:8-oxo-dGTP pyrophosphatase MutT (NUDIX family)
MSGEKWHRHFGVYGICFAEGKLLVVNKTSGPYKNRFDLPGGTMEPSETVEQALGREFKEETGLGIVDCKALGFSEFIVRYRLRDNSHIQHIPLFFQVECRETGEYTDLELSDDSSGYQWVLLEDINDENATPLVMKAKDVILSKEFAFESRKLDEWETRGL